MGERVASGRPHANVAPEAKAGIILALTFGLIVMIANRDKDVAASLRDLLKLRKRTGMADSMFFSTMVELALDFGVESLMLVTPKELKASFAEWFPEDVDDLIFVPRVSSEKDKALRETMKLLKQHLSGNP